MPHTYGVFEPCGCLSARLCQSVRFCHCMFVWTSGGKLKVRPPWLRQTLSRVRWCHFSSLLGSFYSVCFICALYLFLDSNTQKTVGFWLKLWIQLKPVQHPSHWPSEDFCESARIDSMGHCSFPVFPLSLWINCVSQAFHQLSPYFFIYFFFLKDPDGTVSPASPRPENIHLDSANIQSSNMFLLDVS